ncbi:MAG: hypothetical protein ACYC3B_07370 [Sedimentisphaerales bacterium]
MEYIIEHISQIICAIIGAIAGVGIGIVVKVKIDNSRNSVVQKNITAEKVVGRDDKSTTKK